MADSLDIHLNLDLFDKEIAEIVPDVVEALTGIIDGVNQIVANRVKENLGGVVLRRQSGKLQDSVQVIPATHNGAEVHGSVIAGGEDAPYGVYFENGGTSPYEIRPVSARVLAFMMEGQQIFAQVVNHPPTPHLPWFDPAVESSMGEIEEAIYEGFGEVLNE